MSSAPPPRSSALGGSKEELVARVKQYRAMITSGCGNLWCINPECATHKEFEPRLDAYVRGVEFVPEGSNLSAEDRKLRDKALSTKTLSLYKRGAQMCEEFLPKRRDVTELIRAFETVSFSQLSSLLSSKSYPSSVTGTQKSLSIVGFVFEHWYLLCRAFRPSSSRSASSSTTLVDWQLFDEFESKVSDLIGEDDSLRDSLLNSVQSGLSKRPENFSELSVEDCVRCLVLLLHFPPLLSEDPMCHEHCTLLFSKVHDYLDPHGGVVGPDSGRRSQFETVMTRVRSLEAQLAAIHSRRLKQCLDSLQQYLTIAVLNCEDEISDLTNDWIVQMGGRPDRSRPDELAEFDEVLVRKQVAQRQSFMDVTAKPVCRVIDSFWKANLLIIDASRKVDDLPECDFDKEHTDSRKAELRKIKLAIDGSLAKGAESTGDGSTIVSQSDIPGPSFSSLTSSSSSSLSTSTAAVKSVLSSSDSPSIAPKKRYLISPLRRPMGIVGVPGTMLTPTTLALTGESGIPKMTLDGADSTMTTTMMSEETDEIPPEPSLSHRLSLPGVSMEGNSPLPFESFNNSGLNETVCATNDEQRQVLHRHDLVHWRSRQKRGMSLVKQLNYMVGVFLTRRKQSKAASMSSISSDKHAMEADRKFFRELIDVMYARRLELLESEGSEDFSYLDYPYLLDSASKSRYIEYENYLLQKSSRREEFMRAITQNGMFASRSEMMARLHLVMSVRRQNILPDTVNVLSLYMSGLADGGSSSSAPDWRRRLFGMDEEPEKDDSDTGGAKLRRKLQVIFDGEDGVDQGGLTKEYFQLITSEILNPSFGMFSELGGSSDSTDSGTSTTTTKDDEYKVGELSDSATATGAERYWFNRNSLSIALMTGSSEKLMLDNYRMVGILIGIAIYNDVILDLRFPKVLYNKLLGLDLTWDDLKDYDSELCKGMNNLLHHDSSKDGDIEFIYMRNFADEYINFFGEKIVEPFFEGGESFTLKESNREYYVDCYIRHLLDGSIRKQFQAFQQGFYTVVKGSVLFANNRHLLRVASNKQRSLVDQLSSILSPYLSFSRTHSTASVAGAGSGAASATSSSSSSSSSLLSSDLISGSVDHSMLSADTLTAKEEASKTAEELNALLWHNLLNADSYLDRRNFFFNHGMELELLICGNGTDESKYDFELLMKSCRYQDGFTEKSQTVRDFWDIVLHELSFEQKKKMLSFITGTDRVPIRGLSDVMITMSKNGSDDSKLPTSHTCFNHILLPQYSSKDILKQRLLVAIENALGFGLL